jgi:formate dehydrogenase gamma subunit
MHWATLLLTSAAFAWNWSVPPAQAQDARPQECADCHAGEASEPSLAERLATSVHADNECTDCHASISMDDLDQASDQPHGETVAPVDCGECHEEAAEVYRKHGRLVLGTDEDLPTCWDCHGAHDVLETSDPRSRAHPFNLSQTCKTCHADTDMVKRHEYLQDAPIRLYESSVHGQAVLKGRYLAATCNDCHSAPGPGGERTGHRILGAGDPESPIHFFRIPETCGECHEPYMKDYWDGIHGQMVKRGKVDAPVCTTCHGEHGIIRPSDRRSPVSGARVAEATCSPCHESEVLNEKYGLPPGRLKSYVDSYHGLKSKASTRDRMYVANCASCHGAHRILPHTDPTSSIHPDNLQETCGECHEEISAELATISIHESATGIKTGWAHFFTVLYIWLIVIVIGGMILHNVADITRHVKIMRKKPFVVRMTANETLQHWLLTLSFVVLVLSGFSLRFSEAFWVNWFFGWGDGQGFVFRGDVHRVAAVVFIFTCVWHLLYLAGRRGRRALRDITPGKKDLADIRDNILFFVGLRPERPSFGRFNYMEKAEYWALLWGAVIMTGTGILLWFDNFFVERMDLPKGVLDVMLVIHYYEAWLATLAIFVWHGYSAIYSPHVYPMNPAWINGTMPKEMYLDEHPEGPRLKARVRKILDEEELEPETNRGSDDSTGQ